MQDLEMELLEAAGAQKSAYRAGDGITALAKKNEI
jgi:hypothetical protein